MSVLLKNLTEAYENLVFFNDALATVKPWQVRDCGYCIENVKNAIASQHRAERFKNEVSILRAFFKASTTSKAALVSSRLKGLLKQLKKPDTPPLTITLETIRTSAAIFRRVGICA
jgi:hypothetical protein